MTFLKRLVGSLRREEGQGLVEYALLICLVALCIGAAVYYFGSYISVMFIHFVEVIAAWCQF